MEQYLPQATMMMASNPIKNDRTLFVKYYTVVANVSLCSRQKNGKIVHVQYKQFEYKVAAQCIVMKGPGLGYYFPPLNSQKPTPFEIFFQKFHFSFRFQFIVYISAMENYPLDLESCLFIVPPVSLHFIGNSQLSNCFVFCDTLQN